VLQGDHAAEHVQRALLAPRVARLVRDAGIPG